MDTVQRVRAARGSVNQSLDDFAKAVGIGRQTLVRIESGQRELKPHEEEAMARVSGLPIEFFRVADLHDALAGSDQAPSLAERVAQLERDMMAVKRSAAAGAPAPGGELGRRLEEHQTTSRDPGAHDSHPGTDAQRGTGQ